MNEREEKLISRNWLSIDNNQEKESYEEAITYKKARNFFWHTIEVPFLKWNGFILEATYIIRVLIGWFEGYAPGIRNQSNGIEKAFEDIKGRTSCIKFIKGKRISLLE